MTIDIARSHLAAAQSTAKVAAENLESALAALLNARPDANVIALRKARQAAADAKEQADRAVDAATAELATHEKVAAERAEDELRIPVNPGSQSGSTRSPVPDDPGAIGA